MADEKSSKKCMSCGGPMWPIVVIDKGGEWSSHQNKLEYTLPESRRPALLAGHYHEVEGEIQADMCDDCGLVQFYGYPYKQPRDPHRAPL